MRERFTHACNNNQLIILARKEGNLPRRAAAGGEVEGDWAKKKGQGMKTIGVQGMKTMEFEISFYIEVIDKVVNFTTKLIVHNLEL